MGDTLLTALCRDSHHPSTILSMDSSASSSHEEIDLELNPQIILTTHPPDINLPLSADQSPPLQQPWISEPCDILDVGLGTAIYETESFLNVPKVGRKFSKRTDNIWGAWFFFSFYFKPVLKEKAKAKIIRDSNGVLGFDKADLQLDTFLVQHDMENMYMWVFKERPENALGKMQLRSYMNGHSRQGERPFPFSTDKGFARSHRMQRKHYRGLSNPQCVHGIEVVLCPNLSCMDEEDRRRWSELTGRELNFTIPPGAIDYSSWRNLPNTEFELERQTPPNPHPHPRKLIALGPSAQDTNIGHLDLSPISNKRKMNPANSSDSDSFFMVNASDHRGTHLGIFPDDPHWLTYFSGVVRNVNGPVTAARTIYEDEEGYLIVVSLPFVDLQGIKVCWRNTPTHGIIKLCCTSTSGTQFIKRHNRTFKLTDQFPEHCPPGEFVREIPLPTRIPEDANIKAYYDGPGTVLEILVPKLQEVKEEHEVRVCLRPHHDSGKDLLLN